MPRRHCRGLKTTSRCLCSTFFESGLLPQQTARLQKNIKTSWSVSFRPSCLQLPLSSVWMGSEMHVPLCIQLYVGSGKLDLSWKALQAPLTTESSPQPSINIFQYLRWNSDVYLFSIHNVYLFSICDYRLLIHWVYSMFVSLLTPSIEKHYYHKH